ncbi:hypothetical protein AVEN_123751-1 [Araneus ventricosus]|uniref:Uncharacterized protein n=1 Tax=Araneus ventricosus TaxID=182803 RepID=A0A4Y2BMZ7_ARAVE|nr:hypothetical protein AVEN_123751-1 [Araneus ventricosus]
MQTTQPVTLILWGYCAYPSSRFQNGPSTRFRERASSPLILCGFRFWERGSLPLTQDSYHHYPLPQFSIMAHRAEWKTGPDENPNILTTPRQPSLDFDIDDGCRSDVLQMVWSGALVNGGKFL